MVQILVDKIYNEFHTLELLIVNSAINYKELVILEIGWYREFFSSQYSRIFLFKEDNYARKIIKSKRK